MNVPQQLTYIASLAIIGVISCATFARSQSLELQEMCATQSRKAFQAWEYEFRSDAAGKMFTTVSSDYQSHFNTKLKKCLVLMEATRTLGNQSSTSILLTDAFERRVYASYLWISRDNKKYWEVAPMACELIPPFGKRNTAPLVRSLMTSLRSTWKNKVWARAAARLKREAEEDWGR